VLGLIVVLIVLALFIGLIAKPILAGLGAPPWLFQVVVGLALIVAVILIAQAFGVSTPALK
jgi:hypothetical protein